LIASVFTAAFLTRATFIACALWLCLELPSGKVKKNFFF